MVKKRFARAGDVFCFFQKCTKTQWIVGRLCLIGTRSGSCYFQEATFTSILHYLLCAAGELCWKSNNWYLKICKQNTVEVDRLWLDADHSIGWCFIFCCCFPKSLLFNLHANDTVFAASSGFSAVMRARGAGGSASLVYRTWTLWFVLH